MSALSEYPPLLAPGFTDVTLDDLDRLFVEPFPSPWARRKLLERFRRLVALLQDLGLDCEIWIDGSFVTGKPDPGDIDVVILSDDETLARLTVWRAEQFRRIVAKKDLTRERYGCDLFYCDRKDQGQRSYWRGWFGFSHSESPKGIARLHVKPL